MGTPAMLGIANIPRGHAQPCSPCRTPMAWVPCGVIQPSTLSRTEDRNGHDTVPRRRTVFEDQSGSGGKAARPVELSRLVPFIRLQGISPRYRLYLKTPW